MGPKAQEASLEPTRPYCPFLKSEGVEGNGGRGCPPRSEGSASAGTEQSQERASGRMTLSEGSLCLPWEVGWRARGGSPGTKEEALMAILPKDDRGQRGGASEATENSTRHLPSEVEAGPFVPGGGSPLLTLPVM